MMRVHPFGTFELKKGQRGQPSICMASSAEGQRLLVNIPDYSNLLLRRVSARCLEYHACLP